MIEDNRNLLRISEVSKRTTISKPHIYTLIRQGKFPKPIKLSVNSSAWLENDINTWLDARINARGAA